MSLQSRPPNLILRIPEDLPQTETSEVNDEVEKPPMIHQGHPLRKEEDYRNLSLEKARKLLENPKVDRQELLICATKKGWLEIVDRLLRWRSHRRLSTVFVEDRRVDPSAEDNLVIKLASAYDHPEIVNRLLEDKRVDPSAEDNRVIKLASAYGRSEVVNRLLKDKRVDPSAENNIAIKFASLYGYLEVVDCLLQDKRVDPSAEDNRVIKLASMCGHLEVVNRLLKDKRVDPSAQDNKAINLAFDYGHFKVVHLLQEDKRVCPPSDDDDRQEIPTRGVFGRPMKCICRGRFRRSILDPSMDNLTIIRLGATKGVPLED